jgi:hypothetical protein
MTLFSNFSKAAGVVAILTAIAVDTAHAQPASSSPDDQPSSYPMTCRGGGTLTISNNNNTGMRGRRMPVQIKFQPGRGAASQGLSPGQCSWSDRALRPGEPTTICDNSASAAQYVGQLVQPDQYAIMQVYNNGRQDCMQVTRAGA